MLTHLEAQFVSFASASAATPEMGAHGRADARRPADALRPFANDRQHLTFAEKPVDASAGYRPEVWTRIQGLRRTVDPHGRFVADHPVPRLWENGGDTT